MTFRVIEANPTAQASMLIGGALINVLVPLAKKEVPELDPGIGEPLRIGPDGCGTTFFAALPSAIAPFFVDMGP